MCSKHVPKDSKDFGLECTKSRPKYQEVIVEYESDVSRLKKEAAAFAAQHYGEEGVKNADFFVIANATLLTMEAGNVKSDVLRDAVLVTRGGEIEAIVGVHDAVFPYGATVIDVEGGQSRTLPCLTMQV